MSCKKHSHLVDTIQILNSKLNTLSLHRVSDSGQQLQISEQRDSLLNEMRHHRRKGHDGKPCPDAPRVVR
jgi:hypothetical protein